MEKGSMRIAVINQEAGGGATVFARSLASLFEKEGDKVQVFPSQVGQSAQQLFDALKDFNPHILHLHCFYNAYPYSTLAGLSHLFPAVFTLHDCYPMNQIDTFCWTCGRIRWCFPCPIVGPRRKLKIFRERLKKRRIHRRSRLVLVAPSNWLRERIRQTELCQFPIHCIHYGVDINLFRKRANSRKRLGIPEGARVLLFVGNMYSPDDFRKGLPILLQAMEVVHSKVPDSLLLIAGRVLKMGEEEGVRVLGEIQPEDMPHVYSGADLFVNPTWAETGGITNLEAAACSVPVVSTKGTAVPEYVEDGVNGLLVAPGDPERLGEAVATLLQDSQKREEMGRRGREAAETRFDIREQAKRYRNLFLSLLEE